MRLNIKIFNEVISSLLRFCFKQIFSIKMLILLETLRKSFLLNLFIKHLKKMQKYGLKQEKMILVMMKINLNKIYHGMNQNHSTNKTVNN